MNLSAEDLSQLTSDLQTAFFNALQRSCYECLLNRDLKHLLEHEILSVNDIFPEEILNLINFSMPEEKPIVSKLTSFPLEEEIQSSSVASLATQVNSFSLASPVLKAPEQPKISANFQFESPKFFEEPPLLVSKEYIDPETGVAYPKKGRKALPQQNEGAGEAVAADVESDE